MKKIFFIFFLIYSFPIFAQEWSRDELIQWTKELVQKDISIQYTRTLEQQQMDKGEIEEILNSPEFKLFSQRVIALPKVSRAIEAYVDRMSQVQEPAVSQRVLTNSALKDFSLNAAASRNKTLQSSPKKGAVQTFWERAKSFLFEG